MMGMEMLLLIITLLYWSWLGFFFLSRGNEGISRESFADRSF
jgi:hypothetical protein